MNDYDHNRLLQDMHQQIRMKAKISAASITGKITAIQSGQRYDVTTSDGKVYRSIPVAIPEQVFDLGIWIIMESTESDWQIVGYSGSAFD